MSDEAINNSNDAITCNIQDRPRSSLELRLTAAKKQLGDVESKIKCLSARSSAKLHRSLLEERDIALAQVERLHRQISALDTDYQDWLSIGPAQSIAETVTAILSTCTDRLACAKYLQNSLLHAIILSMIEASIDASFKYRVSEIVNLILDLEQICIQLSIPDIAQMTRLFVGVYSNPAITRLPFLKLLDTKTTQRWQDRGKLVEVKAKIGSRASGKDIRIEYWLLTRPWVSDDELMIDSYALKPRSASELDLESIRQNFEGGTSDAGYPSFLVKAHDGTDLGEQRQTLQTGPSAIDVPVPEVAINSDEHQSANDEIFDNHKNNTLDKSEHEKEIQAPPLNDYKADENHDSDDNNDENQDDGDFAISFPSVPSTALPTESRFAGQYEEVDESEVQRLLTLFASSPATASDSGQESDNEASPEEESDLSGLADLTPAEQEEVMKALASAQERYRAPDTSAWAGDVSIKDLIKHAQEAMQEITSTEEDQLIPAATEDENKVDSAELEHDPTHSEPSAKPKDNDHDA